MVDALVHGWDGAKATDEDASVQKKLLAYSGRRP